MTNRYLVVFCVNIWLSVLSRHTQILICFLFLLTTRLAEIADLLLGVFVDRV
jgi:hypothetical protein